nr:ABC transporter ATP-binding protein [Sporichthyaceae bacterium]
AAGGTVIFSSHVMELVERLCDHVAVIAAGRVLASGPIESVRDGRSLEEVFVGLVGGGRSTGEGLSWLGTSSG